MAIERIIADMPSGPLVGGLTWRPVVGKPSQRALQQARELNGASHYTLITVAGRSAYGLFQLRPSEEKEKIPKNVSSAAGAFAQIVGQSAPNAALVIRLPYIEGQKDDRIYVVVLAGGIPVTDKVTGVLDSRNALGDEERPIYSDDDVSFPSCELVTLEWLTQGVGKSTRLAKVPLNPIPLVVATVVTVAVGVGYMSYLSHKKAEAARKAAEAAAAADPVPRYLAALASQQGTMSTDRADVVAGVEALLAMPVTAPGWALASVDCVAAAQTCTSVWKRHGGTFDELKRAANDQHLVFLAAHDGGVPKLDEVATSRSFKVKRESLPLLAASGVPPGHAPVYLPDLQGSFGKYGPELQVWSTAGLSVNLSEPKLWPAAAGVPSNFSHPKALQRGDFVVGNVIGPFAVEALRRAPESVSWERVKLTLGASADAKGRLTFELIGNYYVSAKAGV